MTKKNECARCGKCCLAPMVMIVKPSDYRRWVRQGRTDILAYVFFPPESGYGDFRTEPAGTGPTGYCPFARQEESDTFICSIQDTKPEVCRRFFCEWCYGEGKKGLPFKTAQGWTDQAKKLGYGRPDLSQ